MKAITNDNYHQNPEPPIKVNRSPAILNIIAFRNNDKSICPNYDCLILEALVEDNGPFANLTALWSY